MDKLKQESVDLTELNIEKIGMLFPNVITESKDDNGNLKKAINFMLLKQMLSKDVVDGDECYEFTWVGKKQSIIEGNTPIRKTLRPCKKESKDWDKTENLYIEGDNLEVLKLLQGPYLNSIKMIYIDPPYNTGNDFVYRDNFATSKDEYEEEAGVFDEDENRLFKNSKSNGRYHSDWCSMIYPRLQLARNLLSDYGVIFVSIDDNEHSNLKKICDEVFGEQNRISNIININNPKGRSDDKYIATAHEGLLIYAKNIDRIFFSGFAPTEKVIKRYNKVDSTGKKYRLIDLRKTGDSDRREDRPNMFYYFQYNKQTGLLYPSIHDEDINGCVKIYPTKDDGSFGRWRWGIDNAIKNIAKLTPIFMKVKNKWTVMELDYLSDEETVKSTSVWDYKDVNSERGTEQFIELGFNKGVFERPKPIGTIKRALTLVSFSDDIVLDFFSGSATTAHAVMQLNAEDGGNRKFIMVQIPEETDEKSDAYKAGYKNICEIGKERIRRAGAKILEEFANRKRSNDLFDSEQEPKKIDTGFRVLKVDSTNMKDVYYGAPEYSQQLLLNLESNIKEGRTDLDLLFGVLVDWGVSLSFPLETKMIEGKAVHFVNDTDLVACFEESISESLIRKVAKAKPMRVVFRDSSFANSPDKINVTEIFKTISPETTIKVI